MCGCANWKNYTCLAAHIFGNKPYQNASPPLFKIKDGHAQQLKAVTQRLRFRFVTAFRATRPSARFSQFLQLFTEICKENFLVFQFKIFSIIKSDKINWLNWAGVQNSISSHWSQSSSIFDLLHLDRKHGWSKRQSLFPDKIW